MSDWHAARGVRSSFAADEGRQFSLGRLVQGMAGRGWAGAELEQRALAAGADATGGVLVPEPLAAFVIDRIAHRSACSKPARRWCDGLR